MCLDRKYLAEDGCELDVLALGIDSIHSSKHAPDVKVLGCPDARRPRPVRNRVEVDAQVEGIASHRLEQQHSLGLGMCPLDSARMADPICSRHRMPGGRSARRGHVPVPSTWWWLRRGAVRTLQDPSRMLGRRAFAQELARLRGAEIARVILVRHIAVVVALDRLLVLSFPDHGSGSSCQSW